MAECKVNAVQTAEKFSWETIVEKTESVFFDVISQYRSPVQIGLNQSMATRFHKLYP
jgi:hypothetical protein